MQSAAARKVQAHLFLIVIHIANCPNALFTVTLRHACEMIMHTCIFTQIEISATRQMEPLMQLSIGRSH